MTKNEIALQITLAAIEKGTIVLSSRRFEEVAHSDVDRAILLAEAYAIFYNTLYAKLEAAEGANTPNARGYSEKPANF